MTRYQNVFFNAVNNILNSDGETFPSGNIRFAYQEMGQPFFNRGETYVYIDLFETDFETNRHMDFFYKVVDDDLIESRTSMKRIICRFILYGDNALNIANKIRLGLYDDSIRKTFKKESLFLIPDIPSPILTKELINNTWFKRVDFDVNYNGLCDIRSENLGGISKNTIQININGGV